MTLDDLEDELERLDISKASHVADIPIKILKENVDLFSTFMLTSATWQ